MGEEVKNWLEQAKDDLETAKYLFEGKRYKQSSFFSQQAAEKGLKAILLQRTKKLIKVHDLVKLAKEINLDEEMVYECEKLSAVYIDARYPDVGSGKYTKEETQDDLKIAEKVLKWVEKNI